MHHVPNLTMIKPYKVHVFAGYFSRIPLKVKFVRGSVFSTGVKGCISKGKQMRKFFHRNGARKPTSQDFCEAQIYDACESSTNMPCKQPYGWLNKLQQLNSRWHTWVT